MPELLMPDDFKAYIKVKIDNQHFNKYAFVVFSKSIFAIFYSNLHISLFVETFYLVITKSKNTVHLCSKIYANVST